MATQRNATIKELEDEINMNLNGTFCAPRHVKLLCRRIVQVNTWKISRMERGKNINNVPSTVYFSKLNREE